MARIRDTIKFILNGTGALLLTWWSRTTPPATKEEACGDNNNNNNSLHLYSAFLNTQSTLHCEGVSCREEGTGVLERARGETVRRHGQRGSGQQGIRGGRRCRRCR